MSGTPPRKVSVRGVRWIHPRRREVAPGGSSPRPFSAVDLRATVRNVAGRLSPRRRAAAMIPLLIAGVSWFTIPSYAADHQFTGNGMRDVGITSDGTFGLWSNALGGYQTFARGYVAAGYWNLTNGADGAYCVTLSKNHNGSDVLHDAQHDFNTIAYILNTHTPAAHPSDELSNRNDEAAAVQLAVWEFTDGSLDHPVHGNWPSIVVNRARAIANYARDHAAAWDDRQSEAHHLSAIHVTPSSVQVPGSVQATVTLLDSNNHPFYSPGIKVHWTLEGGQLNNTSNPAMTSGDSAVDQNGSTAVQVFHLPANTPGTVKITATLKDDWHHAAEILVPNRSSDQNLAYARAFERESTVSANATFTAPPPPPTATPTPTPTAPPTATPTPTPTAPPTATPTPTPAPPTATPTPAPPTATPTPTPTPTPAPGPTCYVPSPTIEFTNAPTSYIVGQEVTFTVVATNGSVAQTVANVITVTLGPGFTYQSSTPQGAVNGQQIAFNYPTLAANQSVTINVTAIVPNQATDTPVLTSATMVSQSAPVAGCPQPTAMVGAVTSGAIQPVSAVQGLTTTPVIAATSPEVTTPTTGAASGTLRLIVVGICLMVSGLIIVTGRRREDDLS